MAAVTALLLALALGVPTIRLLKRRQIGQSVREDGPRSHLSKAGTPTMGGILILLSVVLATLLWMDLTNRLVWIALGTLVGIGIVGSSNAVNLTDGLDGLAIGAFGVAAGTYALLSYVSGNAVAARYLQIAYVPQAGELSIFCGAMVGASLGFLWYNSHPADVFMGDVGALPLGGALAAVAVMTKQEMLLAIVGGVFVLETLSVIVQVASFQTTGKRVFRMAPLHHHFELSGWSEPKVISRFVIVAIIFALFSLTTLKLR